MKPCRQFFGWRGLAQQRKIPRIQVREASLEQNRHFRAVLARPARELKSVKTSGHANITEKDISHCAVCEKRNRFVRRFDGRHPESVALQRKLQNLAKSRVVLDQQYMNGDNRGAFVHADFSARGSRKLTVVPRPQALTMTIAPPDCVANPSTTLSPR